MAKRGLKFWLALVTAVPSALAPAAPVNTMPGNHLPGLILPLPSTARAAVDGVANPASVAPASTGAIPNSDSIKVKQVQEQVAALRSSVICAFNQLLDLKDLNTGVHSTRLAEWGMRVGQEMGLEEAALQNLEVAALLHDIGKVGVPDAILKKPGKLDADEYALMKKHPEFGWAVLRMLPGFEHAALDILHHHENFDGTGYPAGLKETEIPVVSRIVSVIDAFDAMVSFRPYRKGLPYEEAVRRLILASGTQFDPVVVQCFLSFAQAEMATVFAAAGTSVTSAL